jgi:uroporphyrinogen-III synthase
VKIAEPVSGNGSVEPVLRQCGFAVLLVTSALVCTLLLKPLFPYPFYLLFFPAVMAAAWFGGMASGSFAVVLSTMAVAYFLEPPIYSLAVNATDLAYFGAFVICSVVATWISSNRRRQEDALLDARVRLEARVAEDSAELNKSKSELQESERGLKILAEVIPQQIWKAQNEDDDEVTSAAAPLEDVLAQVVKFVVSLVKCDSCFLYVLEGNELILRASKNPRPEVVDRISLKIGQGITGWVAERRQPVAVSHDAADDPRFRLFNELPEDQFESFLSVPILSRGRVVGVMNFQNRAPYSYNEREISLLSTIGFLVGAEIELAQLEAEKSEISKKLIERKLVERAKGILQQDFDLDEENAYLMLQRESRKRRISMREFAQSVIVNYEVRRGKDRRGFS